jgi:hypothetical protein
MNSDIKYLSDNNYISHIKNQYLICISEESFNNLFNEEKEDLLNALYRFIINEEIYLRQRRKKKKLFLKNPSSGYSVVKDLVMGNAGIVCHCKSY